MTRPTPGGPIPLADSSRLQLLEEMIGRQQDQIATLERRLANIRQPQQVWLAKTTKTTTYPGSSADTFEIVLVDGTFTETAGDQTPTYTNRAASPQKVAHNISGQYIAEDTYVWVFRTFSTDGKHKWWIDRPAAGGTVEWDQVTGAGDSSMSLSDVSDLVGGSLDLDGDGIVTYASGTGTMTISADGTYEFHANVEHEFDCGVLAGQISGQVQSAFKVVSGGTTRYNLGVSSHVSGSGVSRFTVAGSVILILEANDTVNIETNVLGHTSATSMNGQSDLNQWTVKKLP